jgi:hypothetical protein
MNARLAAALVSLGALALAVGGSADPAIEIAASGISVTSMTGVGDSPTPAPQVGTSLYRSPTGLMFRHPVSWQVRTTSTGGLNLVPGDMRTVGGRPAEFFTIVGESAAGVQSAENARVASFVTRLVTRGFPYLRSTGGMRRLTVEGRDCVESRFAGTHAGVEFMARAQVTVLADTVLMAFVLTSKDRFAERCAAMDIVFRGLRVHLPGSAEFGPVNRDPRLIGRWRYTKVYSSGNFTSTVVRYLVLAADGSCQEGGRMMAGMMHGDGRGSFAGSSSANAGGGADVRGHWRTDGRQVIINWDGGGTTVVRFQTNGGSMLWSAGGESKLWERI